MPDELLFSPVLQTGCLSELMFCPLTDLSDSPCTVLIVRFHSVWFFSRLSPSFFFLKNF